MQRNDELISANALLEKVQLRVEAKGVVGSTVKDVVEITRKLIDEAPAVDAVPVALAKDTVFGMWIPVTQALPHFFPERRRKVFVTLEDRDGKRFTSVAKYNEKYKHWEEFTDYRFSDSRYFKVVAWMVKPAPWKEDKHGSV